MAARVPGLTQARRAWIYKRWLPADVQAVAGRREWFRYIGLTSKAEAEDQARRFRAYTDKLIERARSLTPAEREAAIKAGGLEKLDKLDRFILAAVEPGLDGPAVDPDLDLADPVQARLAADQALSVHKGRQLVDDVRRRHPRQSRSGRPGVAVQDLVETWRRRVQPRSLTTLRHMRAYAAKLDQFTGAKPADKLTQQDLRDFRDYLEGLSIKRSTAATIFGKVSTLLSHAVDAGVIESNPAAGISVLIPHVERMSDAATVKTMTPAQMELLASKLGELPADFAMIIRLMAHHGTRAREVASLDKADLINVDGIMCMNIREAKNVSSNRVVPLHQACFDFVAYVDKIETANIFAGSTPALRSQRFRDKVNPWLRSHGLLSAHSLRHTWRSMAVAIGMPVDVAAAIMGHSLRSEHFSYGQVNVETMKKWLDQINPFA